MFQTRQFSNIQKYLASIRKHPNVPPIVYLSNTRGESDREKADLFNRFFKSVYNEKKTTQINPQHRILSTIDITDVEIEQVLENLKLNKATGADKLGNIILKQCSKSLSKSLKLVLQTALNKGVYPKYCKISQISPIFKEGNTADVKCYRPISLLCCISKVLERLIFNALSRHCKVWLHQNQFGFRKNRSATIQLLIFLDSIEVRPRDG